MMRRSILLVFLVILLAGCGGDSVRLQNGDAAPDFTLTDLNGNSVQLSSLRGQVVAVRFWADWCPYCEGEMRALEPVYQRLRGTGFQMLAINVGQPRVIATRFVERIGISYPALLDTESEVAKRYGVIALPTTVLVDQEGKVRGKILGESEAATFEAMVRQLAIESGTKGIRP